MLGGKDNFPADREAARRTFDVLGEDVVRGTVLQNRRFLGRAVRYLAREAGIRQFLDIGTGLPTMGNVHEAARAEAPRQPRRLRRQRPGGDLARRLHAARRRRHRDRRPRPAGSARDHRGHPGPFGAQLRSSDRGPAGRDPAFRGGRGRPGRHRRRPDGVGAAGQLPGDLASVGGPLRGGGQGRRRLPGRVVGAVPADAGGGRLAFLRAAASASRARSSGRRNGTRTRTPRRSTRPAGRRCGAGSPANRDRSRFSGSGRRFFASA